jgi:hypothetical protein
MVFRAAGMIPYPPPPRSRLESPSLPKFPPMILIHPRFRWGPVRVGDGSALPGSGRHRLKCSAFGGLRAGKSAAVDFG